MKIVQPLLVLVLLAVPGWLHASNPKVDSLLHLLETHTAIDRAEVLWAVAYELFDVDNPEAAFYAERAYHEVWAKGDSLQIVKVGTTHTQLQRRLGNLDYSIQMAIPLLQIAKRNNFRKYEKMLLNGLSISYSYKEIYDKALELSYESLAMRQEDGDSSEIGIALGNIGMLHYKLNDYSVSLDYLSRGIKLLGDDSTSIKAQLGTMGASYCELGLYRRAIESYRRAIKIELSDIERASLAQNYSGLAFSYFRHGSLDSAKHFAKLATQQAALMHNIWPLTLGNLLLSRIALQSDNLADSKYFLDKADELSINSDFPYLKLEVLKHKTMYLAKCKGDNESFTLLERYMRGNDSLFHGEAERRIQAVQIKQSQKENQLRIKAQADILDLQDQLLTRRMTFIAIVSGLLLLATVLAVELFRANKKKDAINRLLDVRVVERTKELGYQRDILQHFVDEEKVLKQRVISEVVSQTNTLRGLIHLGKIDKGPNVEQHLSSANALTYEIQNTVCKLGT